MDHDILLLLLLATLTVTSPSKQPKQEITLAYSDCPWNRTINCKSENGVWHFQCSKDNGNMTMNMSLSCDEVQLRNDKCLKIEIPLLGNTDHKLCKRCCKTEISKPKNSCSNSCGKNCKESRSFKNVIEMNITFEQRNCGINLTDDGKTDIDLEFYDEKKSWIKAFQSCHSLNSSLVHITNITVEEEVNYLLQFYTDLDDGIWVGLERSIFGTNLEWKWTSGFTAMEPKWARSFPVDPLNHHCGKIIWLKDLHKMQLVDADCNDKLPYICQG